MFLVFLRCVATSPLHNRRAMEGYLLNLTKTIHKSFKLLKPSKIPKTFHLHSPFSRAFIINSSSFSGFILLFHRHTERHAPLLSISTGSSLMTTSERPRAQNFFHPLADHSIRKQKNNRVHVLLITSHPSCPGSRCVLVRHTLSVHSVSPSSSLGILFLAKILIIFVSFFTSPSPAFMV
jgi:hypothetical protein